MVLELPPYQLSVILLSSFLMLSTFLSMFCYVANITFFPHYLAIFCKFSKVWEDCLWGVSQIGLVPLLSSHRMILVCDQLLIHSDPHNSSFSFFKMVTNMVKITK